MTILFAWQEHPDDKYKCCEIIKSKFEERYGGRGLSMIYKSKDTVFLAYFYEAMFIKYGVYDILIARTIK